MVAVAHECILAVGCVTNSGEITLNYVSPDVRFRGISTTLLDVLERRAIELGNSKLQLESTETARRFYLARGYIEQGLAGGKFGTSSGYPMSKIVRISD
jgi:GNAT superfamily N-acetyltransferase